MLVSKTKDVGSIPAARANFGGSSNWLGHQTLTLKIRDRTSSAQQNLEYYLKSFLEN